MRKVEGERGKQLFLSRIARKGPDECWEFTGGKNSPLPGRNYGQARFNGRKWRAHRLAWVLANGPVPSGMLICHRCDNPPCCNPSHLFLGSTRDNQLDCVRKGRANPQRGEDHHEAKLTCEAVAEIRRRYKPGDPVNGGNALGREFGVCHGMIGYIVHHQRWRHLP